MNSVFNFCGRFLVLVSLTLFPLFPGFSQDFTPVEGGAISFQGILVSADGVPIGTSTPENVCMRFSIISDEPNFTPWESPNLYMRVDQGLFNVRLGKFSGVLYEKTLPINEDIFSGNEIAGHERYLQMEIHPNINDISSQGCLNAIASVFLKFSRQKISEQELEPGSIAENIKIPGVPFSVSSLRIKGNDTKEGTLRISRENNEPIIGEDFAIEAGGSYNGLEVIQNQNLGLIIRQTLLEKEVALETIDGDGRIQGSLQVSGDESNLRIEGDLESVHSTAGGTMRLLGERLGKNQTELIAGSIFSPSFSNPLSKDFEASVTGESRLHKLRVVDIKNDDQTQEVTIDSTGDTNITFFKDGNIELGDQGYLSLRGRKDNLITLSHPDSVIEALGFYDTNQTKTSLKSSYPFQVIPHGLSVLNTLTIGDSRQFSTARLKGLIGEFKNFQGVYDFSNTKVYRDARTGTGLHTHDLRVGADPGGLIEKLNNRSSSTLIVKRRVDNRLAYLFENNDGLTQDRPFYFQDLNIFNHFENSAFDIADPFKNPSAFTYNRIVVGHSFNTPEQKHYGVFLGGLENPDRILLGTNYTDLRDLYFLHCGALEDCDLTVDALTGSTILDPLPLLKFRAATASLEGSLYLTSSIHTDSQADLIVGTDSPDAFALLRGGNIHLFGNAYRDGDGTYLADNFSQLSIKDSFGIGFSSKPSDNPILHAIYGKTRIFGDLLLSRSPITNSSLTLSTEAFMSTLCDQDDPLPLCEFEKDHYLDPSGSSRLSSLEILGGLTAETDLHTLTIRGAKSVLIEDSTNLSGTLTAGFVVDLDSPVEPHTVNLESQNLYLLNPVSINAPPTRLKELTAKGNIRLREEASIGGNLSSTSDFSSEKSLELFQGDYHSEERIQTPIFLDIDDQDYGIRFPSQSQLNQLKLQGDLNGVDLNSNSKTRTMTVGGNAVVGLLDIRGHTQTQLFIDSGDSNYFLNPDSHSSLLVLNVAALNGYKGISRGNTQLLESALASSTVSIAKSLVSSDYLRHFGEVKIHPRTSAEPTFHVNTHGDILAAHRMNLSEGLTLTSKDSVALIFAGISQQSEEGTNILSFTTAYADVHLLHSSLDVSSGNFILESDGNIYSEGSLSLQTSVIAGWKSLKSFVGITNSSIVFDSSEQELSFTNLSLGTPLNLYLNSVVLQTLVTSSNFLVTPVIIHPQGDFKIDPNSISRLHGLSLVRSGGNGGGAIFQGPIHFSSWKDSNLPTHSIDLSGLSTLSRLNSRASTYSGGILLLPSQIVPSPVINIRSSETADHLISLDSGVLSYTQTGFWNTQAPMHLTSFTTIESSDGLVFTSDTGSLDSVKITSNVLYLLAGKEDQLADSLHQHSVIQGRPLTDILRRDIDNVLSEENTFTGSSEAFLLDPWEAGSATVLKQLQSDGNVVITISESGDLNARQLQGDGTYLTGINGSDLKDLSITSADILSGGLDSDTLEQNSVDSHHLRHRTITENHISSANIWDEHIINDSIKGEHIKDESLSADRFQSGAIQGRHLGRQSISAPLLTQNTLESAKFSNESIGTEHIQSNSFTQFHFANQQVRKHHIVEESIDSSRIRSLSLGEVDLAELSIGTEELIDGSIDSRIIKDRAIQTSLIETDSIRSDKILSASLLHEDVATEAIILNRVKDLSIGSREVRDFSIENKDFQDLSITRDKIKDDAIRSHHLQTSSLSAFHLFTSQVLREHLENQTISTSEIKNYSLENEDFLTNTLDPQNLASNSLQTVHFQDQSITRRKISTEGISQQRFQPFLIQSSQITDGVVSSSHILPDNILSIHFKDGSIQAVDIKSSSLNGELIQDFSLLTENLSDFSLDSDNIAQGAVLSAHFLSDSIDSVDIATETLTTERFQAQAVETSHIITASLQSGHFATGSATRGKFKENSVDHQKILSFSLILSNFAQNAVTSGKISNLAMEQSRFGLQELSSADLGERQILSSHILSQAITEELILTGTLNSRVLGEEIITLSKIAPESLVTTNFANESLSAESIATSALKNQNFLDDSIKSFQIETSAISTRLIQGQTIAAGAIKPFSLTSRVVGTNQVTEAKIKQKSLETQNLVLQSITGSLIQTNSLTTRVILSHSILAEHIASGAITAAKLKSSIVTSGNIIDGSILSRHLTTGFALTRHLEDNAVSSSSISSSAILSTHLVQNTLGTNRLKDGSIRDFTIRTQQITGSQIDGTLPPSLFASNSISGDRIADLSIGGGKISSNTIRGRQLENESIRTSMLLTAILVNLHFENSSVTTQKILSETIENQHIADGIIETPHIVDGSLKTTDVLTRTIPGSKFGDGQIQTRNVRNGEIDSRTIAHYSIGAGLFSSASIGSQALGSSIIHWEHITPQSLSGSKVDTGAIQGSNFHENFLLSSEVLASAVFGSEQISPDSIHARHFSTNSISTSKISSIRGIDFRPQDIGSSYLSNQSVTGLEIKDETIGEEDHHIIFLTTTGVLSQSSQKSSTQSNWTTGSSISETILDLEPDSGDEFAFTSGVVLYRASLNSGGSLQEIVDFGAVAGLGFTPDSVLDLDWYHTIKVYVVLRESGQEPRIVEYDINSDTSSVLATGIYEFDRLSSNQILGVDSSGSLLYSTSISFDYPTTVSFSSRTGVHRNPLLSPDEDYGFAVRSLPDGTDQIIRISWNGVQSFGVEEDVTQFFTSDSLAVSDLILERNLNNPELYFTGKIPATGDLLLYQVSTRGTGLTSYSISQPSGSLLVVNNDRFNPYIPDNTITKDHIVNRSIDGNRLIDLTITREDFVQDAADENLFQHESLKNEDFADDSLTYEKWQQRIIPDSKLATSIFSSLKIATASLSNRVIAEASLNGRVISESTFSTAHLISRTIDNSLLREESFGADRLGSNISGDDLALGSLNSEHFQSLSSSVLETNSISAKKIQTRVLGDDHFETGTLQGEDIALQSLSGSNFQTNEMEGNLLVLDAIESSKIETASLDSRVMDSHSVLRENIANASLQSRHLSTGSFLSTHLPLNLITSQILANNSVSSRSLATDSITSSQLTIDSITEPSIALSSIGSEPLATAIFEGSHFASNSLSHSDWISNLTLQMEQLSFSTLKESKLSGTISLGTTYFRSGSFQGNVTNLSSDKILNREVKPVHFQPYTLETIKIADHAVETTHLATASVQERHFSPNSIDGNSFQNSSIQDDHFQTGTLEDSHILSDTIENLHFQDDSLEVVKIRSNTLDNSLLSNRSLSAAKFQSYGILGEDFSIGSVHTTHIFDGELQGSRVQSTSLSSTILKLLTLETSDFANQAVTYGNIAPQTLTAREFQDLGMGSRVFEDGAFTSNKLFYNDDQTVLLIHSDAVDGSVLVTDSSNSEHIVSVAGDTHHETDQEKFYSTALYFDGTGDYLEIPDSDDFTLGTEDFTIDFWIYVPDSSASALLSHFETSSTRHEIRVATLQIRANFDTGATDVSLNAVSAITANTWVHVAYVRNGTDFNLYLNGTLNNNEALTASTSFVDIGGNIYLGSLNSTTTDPDDYFSGYMDEIRFSVGKARWTSNFTPPDLPYEGIKEEKLAANSLTASVLEGNLTSYEFADLTLGDEVINDGAITSEKIQNQSFSGAKFISESVDGSKLKTHTLGASHFSNDAFDTQDFDSNLDITSKVSSSAAIDSDKIKSRAVKSSKLTTALTASNASIIANSILTDGKLSDSIVFDTTHIIDGSLDSTHLASDTISAFVSGSLTSGKFSSSSLGISSKIANSSVQDRHIQTAAIDSSKLSGILSNSALVESTIEGVDFQSLSLVNSEIETGSITSTQLTSQTWLSHSSSHFPTFSASQIQSLTGGQIENNIFNSAHFSSALLENSQVDQIQAANFQENTIGGAKFATLSLGAAQFVSEVLLSEHLSPFTLTNSKIKSGSLTAGHLQTESIRANHFQTKSIGYSDLDTASLDGLFSGTDVDPSFHMHSAFTFRRTTPTGYTLLHDDRYGRTQFAYAIKSSTVLTSAQNQCSSDKAQVCDMNQLIDICRSGTGLDDDFYFSGDPSYVSTAGKEYFIAPLLALPSSSCFSPTSVEWDFGLERLTPVHVNDTIQDKVEDIIFFKNKYAMKMNNRVYLDEDAYVLEGNAALTTHVTTGAPLVYSSVEDNIYTIGKDISTGSPDRIHYISDNLSTMNESTSGYGVLTALDFFDATSNYGFVGYNDNTSGTGDWEVGLVDSSGDLHASVVLGKHRAIRGVQARISSGGIQDGFSLNYVDEAWSEILAHNQTPPGTQFPARSGAVGLSYNNKLWINGGLGSSGNLNDTWSSSNGISWTNVDTNEPDVGLTQFSQRYNHSGAVFDGKMWVIGGNDGSNRLNDVWYSTTGSSWTKVTTPIEQFTKLLIHSSSSDGSVIITDASSSSHSVTVHGDVHHEADEEKFGISSIEYDGEDYWEEVTGAASWTNRSAHGFLSYDSKLWVFGGNDGSNKRNDIYSSTDGENWTLQLGNTGNPGSNQFSQRQSFAATTFAGNMWVIGGEDVDEQNDVWYSTTGASWTEVSNPHEQFTRLLLHSNSTDGNQAFSDSSIKNYSITSHGDVHHETDQEKIGASSIEFDGLDYWTEHTKNASFGVLKSHGSVTFDNKIWVMGGYSEGVGRRNFVYSSTNGENWSEVLSDTGSPSNQWSRRENFATTVFDSKIWVFGGHDGTDSLNDVWHSGDGSDWTQVSNPREQYTKLLIHSDNTDGTTNIVDSSPSSHSITTNGEVHHETDQEKFGTSSIEFDGVDHWVQTTANASFADRSDHGALNYSSKLWVIGGHDGDDRRNDVYSSSDGKSWTQKLGNNTNPGSSQFSQRSQFASTVFSNQMWVIGGDISGGKENDVWRSSNGSSWSKVSNPHEQYTSLLVHSNQSNGSKSFADSSVREKTINHGGDVHHDTGQEKFGSSSIKFDGTDNWIQVTSNPAFSARTGHQVVELSNTLYLTGGRDSNGLSAQIYSSTDGNSWSEKDTSSSSTVLLIHSDHSDNSTSFEDSSGQSHTINIPTNSNVHHDTSPSLFGNSAITFDGNGDFLTVPASSDFDFGTNNLTIELWAYIDDLSNPSAGFSGFVGRQFDSNNRWYFGVGSDGDLKLYVYQGQVRIDIDWDSNLEEDGWYHLALVRNGTNFFAYVNGTSVTPIGSANDSDAFVDFSDAPGGPPPLEIGRRRSSSTIDYFKGSIDELRIIKNSALYTSDFNAPDGRFRQWEQRTGHVMITGGTKISVAGGDNGKHLTNEIWTSSDGSSWDELHWRTNLLIHSDTTDGSTTFTDSSDSRNNPARTITAAGAVHHETDQEKFGNSSIFFDGFEDYIYTEDSADFVFSDHNFTIDTWIRLSSLANYRAICGSWLNNNNRWYLAVDDDGDIFLHAVAAGSTVINGISNTVWSNANLSTNTWYHIALVRDGDDFELFINGVSKGTKTDNSKFPVTTFGLEIGMGRASNSTEYFHGYMDEFRVTHGVARWTSGFTPPANPHQRFSPRRDFAGYKTSSTYYITGGKNPSGNAIQDLWSSTDGIHWKEHTAPTWSARYGHETIVQSSGGTDTVFIFGGNTGSADLNDVWKTSNGSTWTRQTDSAGWSDRSFLEVVEFNDKLWVLGGNASGTNMDDVWYSSTGASWLETEFNANWSARSSQQAVILNGQVLVIGGTSGSLKNDVWKSELSTDFLKVADSSDFSFGTSDITVDLWIYPQDFSESQYLLHHKEDPDNQFYISMTTGKQVKVYYEIDNTVKVNSTSGSLTQNQWNHVAMVRDGSQLNIYVNGTLTSSNSVTGDFGDIDGDLYIGCNSSGKEVFDGYLDEIRFSQGIARWASNFTPRSRRYETFLLPRSGHEAIVFGNNLYVLGGKNSAGTLLASIWSTSDSNGTSWTDHDDASWAGRESFAAVVYNDGTDKLWLMGGSTGSNQNDVWSTTDAHDWVQVNSNADWSDRSGHVALTYNDQMVLLGGKTGASTFDRSVWISTDGSDWNQTTRPGAWAERYAHGGSVFDSKVWILGGNTGANTNDVWYSDLDESKIDFLEIPDSNDFSFGTKDFTFDFWIYDHEQSAAGERYLFNQHVDSSNYLELEIENDQTLKFEFKDSGSQVVSLSTTNTLSTSQWVHVAIVRSGSTLRAYLDGVFSGSASISGSFSNLSANLFIGSHKEGKGVFKGYLDEIRLSPGIARWSQNFTPPTRTYDTFWSARRFHEAVIFNNRVWLLGGRDDSNTRLNEVWSTGDTNGVNWTYHGEADWSGRFGLEAASFSNKLWIFGGFSTGGRSNQIYSSSDGVHWSNEGNGAWSSRTYHQVVITDGKLRLLGGADSSAEPLNDLWSSSDGINWTSGSLAMPWDPRSQHQVTVLSGRAYLTGSSDSSNTSEVFSSDLIEEDVDFLKLADSTDWSPSTSDYTIDFWIYNSEDTGAGVRSILTQKVSTNSLHSLEIQNDNTLTSTYLTSGTTRISLNSSSIVTKNQWNHVALVRSGSNINLYLGGKEAGTATISGGNNLDDLEAELFIGSNPDGNEILDGYLDELRISKGIARWTKNFTPRSRRYETFLEPRKEHTAITFDDRLYILGGSDGTNKLNDVWSTSDSNGTSWTNHSDASWDARTLFPAAIFNDGTQKLWVFGGNGSSNDIWSTTNGDDWVQETATPGFSARSSYQVASYDGKMYLMGGNASGEVNDIWSSSNGTSWAEASLPTPWSPRKDHRSIVHNGLVWLLGGIGGSTSYSDVWNSDMDESKVDFLQLADSADWTLSTTDFTIDFWIYDLEGSGNGERRILNQRKDDSDLHTLVIQNDNTLRISFKNGGTSKLSLDSTSAVTANQWVHVALVRYDATVSVYLDGKSAGSASVENGGDFQDISADLFLGSSESGSKILSGYLDEIRISKGIARWTQNFTPPTRAYDSFLPGRELHQLAVLNNRLYVIGGYDGTNYYSDIWSTNDSNGVNWTNHADGEFSARSSFALTTLSSTLYLLGGFNGNTLRDVWSTTNGAQWTRVSTQADWSFGQELTGLVHKDPRDSKEKIFILGGRSGSNESNEVWISESGSSWEQVDDAEWSARYSANAAILNGGLYLFAGIDNSSYRNDVYQFNYPTTGTHVDYFTFKESDSSHKVQSDSLRLFSGDDALHFHCVGTSGCYISKNSNEAGNILYFTADSTGINPGFTLQSQNLSSLAGGESLTNEIIVHMDHSDVTGASFLYMLASDGDLYKLKLQSDGSIDGSADIEKVPTGLTPSDTYAFQSARVRLKNQGNDEIFITGLADHIVVQKTPRVAKYACCRQSLY